MPFKIVPYLNNETSEEAFKRLSKEYYLATEEELKEFTEKNPKEVEKWCLVFALNEKSRVNSGGSVCVPYAFVVGAYCDFRLRYFRCQLDSDYGVLVSRYVASDTKRSDSEIIKDIEDKLNELKKVI